LAERAIGIPMQKYRMSMAIIAFSKLNADGCILLSGMIILVVTSQAINAIKKELNKIFLRSS